MSLVKLIDQFVALVLGVLALYFVWCATTHPTVVATWEVWLVTASLAWGAVATWRWSLR